MAMRVGVTPVPIPNTKVKTDAADNTWLETTWEDRWLPDLWGISSVGRAPALQAGGHEFESRILHWIRNYPKTIKGVVETASQNGLVAQVVRAHA